MRRKRSVGLSVTLGAVIVVAAVVVYSWWATGTRPFSLSADLAIAGPAALVLFAVFSERAAWHKRQLPRRQEPGASRGALLPWSLIALAAVAMEAVALGLGGRSAGFPTFSTVVDQAVAWHLARWPLFVIWLALLIRPAYGELRSFGKRPTGLKGHGET